MQRWSFCGCRYPACSVWKFPSISTFISAKFNLYQLSVRTSLVHIVGSMNNGDGRWLNREEEEEDENGRGLDAWERAYADDRSWESLQEDESGLLRPIDNKTLYHAQYHRRLRSLSSASTGAWIQKGLIRYLYIVIDLSRVSKIFTLIPMNCSIHSIASLWTTKKFYGSDAWKMENRCSSTGFLWGIENRCFLRWMGLGVLTPHEARHSGLSILNLKFKLGECVKLL